MVDRIIGNVRGTDHKLLTETFWSLNEFYEVAISGAFTEIRSRMRENETDRKVREGNMQDMPTALEIAEEAVRSSVELRRAAAFQTNWDVAGNTVDVGRFVSGEPECMMFNPLRTQTTATRVITLVSMADGNGGGDWKTRGIISAALGLALQRLGLSTEMWADNYGRSVNGNQYQRILIKSTADTLDPARLLFAYGDHDMLDCLAFGCFDGYRKLGPEYEIFYRAYSVRGRGGSEERTRQLEQLYPDGTIFITGILNCPGPEGMRMKVTEELVKLGLVAA